MTEKGFLARVFGGKEAGPVPQTAEDFEAWLIAAVAQKTGVPAEQIDPAQPFTRHGLDSRSAVAISGELEELLGREFSPTLTWDYPSISALAQYLAGPPK